MTALPIPPSYVVLPGTRADSHQGEEMTWVSETRKRNRNDSHIEKLYICQFKQKKPFNAKEVT